MFDDFEFPVERRRIFWLGQRVKSDSHDTPNMLMRSAARRTRASVPYLIPFKYNSNAFDRLHLSLLLYIRCNVTFAIVLEILFYSGAPRRAVLLRERVCRYDDARNINVFVALFSFVVENTGDDTTDCGKFQDAAVV